MIVGFIWVKVMENIVSLEVTRTQCNSGLVAHGGYDGRSGVCHEAIKNLEMFGHYGFSDCQLCNTRRGTLLKHSQKSITEPNGRHLWKLIY